MQLARTLHSSEKDLFKLKRVFSAFDLSKWYMIAADQIDGDGCITKQELKTFLKRFLEYIVFLIVAALEDLSQNLRP